MKYIVYEMYIDENDEYTIDFTKVLGMFPSREEAIAIVKTTYPIDRSSQEYTFNNIEEID